MDTSVILAFLFIIALAVVLAICRNIVNRKETLIVEQKVLSDTYYEICPKCGKTLTEEEKANQKCSECGKNLPLLKEAEAPNSNSNIVPQNTYTTILKLTGLITIIVGIIISIGLANVEVQGYYYSHHEFSVLSFCLYMVIFCASGFFLMGFGEVIQILDDIRNK